MEASLSKRSSGLLLHITSLPSDQGIGDLGPAAHRFTDLLSRAGQTYWQILPLSPTSSRFGNSPYNSESVFAGNPLLISPERLVDEGLLPGPAGSLSFRGGLTHVNYFSVSEVKHRLMQKAYERFKQRMGDYRDAFDVFCTENSQWLDDYALYRAILSKIGRPWYQWPHPLRNREKAALAEEARRLADKVELEKFTQFVFFSQWRILKNYCTSLGIQIIGDLPFYVNYESADVWAHPDLFMLDATKQPIFVSGVPPDYFSEDGQLWGNPVYNWEELLATRFDWWMERIRHSSRLFDEIRLDHFRGLIAYWAIPAGSETAKNGQWIKTPSSDFFKTLFARFPKLPLIAEDLGVVTPDVEDTMRRYGIAGLKVLLFAFNGSPENTHLPHNHTSNSVVMSGTHDTNTVRGWLSQEASRKTKKELSRYFGRRLTTKDAADNFVRMALMSVARLSITPVQDVLSLGAEARMNHPGRRIGNWEWRITSKQLDSGAFRFLRDLTETYGRSH
jgi:4-alpha-glucanotransferase